MEKADAKIYAEELEKDIDHSLKLWKKESRVENGEVIQFEWQFEQAHITVDIFWLDEDEGVNICCSGPRFNWRHEFSQLNEETIKNVLDRVGNWAQVVMAKYRK